MSTKLDIIAIDTKYLMGTYLEYVYIYVPQMKSLQSTMKTGSTVHIFDTYHCKNVVILYIFHCTATVVYI